MPKIWRHEEIGAEAAATSYVDDCERPVVALRDEWEARR